MGVVGSYRPQDFVIPSILNKGGILAPPVEMYCGMGSSKADGPHWRTTHTRSEFRWVHILGCWARWTVLRYWSYVSSASYERRRSWRWSSSGHDCSGYHWTCAVSWRWCWGSLGTGHRHQS